MGMLKKIFKSGLLAVLVLVGGPSGVVAQGASGITTFGGELRSTTRIKGKVLCTACTLKEAVDANPDVQARLYEFRNGAEPAVFQLMGLNEVGGIDDPNEVARWSTVVGQRRQLSVRMQSALWKQFISEENLQKEVELTTLLRNTGVLDVGVLNFLAVEQ
jgi:hypothetical protein